MQLVKKTWKDNCLYKHTQNTDVAMYVIDSFEEEDGWNLYICWFNIGLSHKPYSMNIRDTVKVKKEDIKNWQEMVI